MKAPLSVNGSLTPAEVIEATLRVMESTCSEGVEVMLERNDWQDVRGALIKGVCAAGLHAWNNGKVPGFYTIRHAHDEPEWRQEYQYVSVFCDKITFIKRKKEES